MSRVAFAGAATLALLIWMALPLGTRAFPLPLGGFPAGPALYGLAAGLLMAFSLKFLVHGLSPIALPVAAVGWGLGLFAQTVLLLFAPGLAAILGWQVTEVYFAASAVAGVAGGTGLATAARLAGPPIAWWAGSLSVGVWGVLWWLEPYLFFNVRVELAGRVEPIGFAIIDAVLLGLAGLIGFLALLALWQPRRWPRWRRADRARDD